MGLTIHYRLSAPAGSERNVAWQLVSEAAWAAQRRVASGGFRSVGHVGWNAEHRRWSRRWREIPLPSDPPATPGCISRSYYDLEIEPAEGCMFEVDVGRDCELLSVGLCRYPLSLPMPWQLHAWLPPNRRRQKISTGLPPGWYFHGFAKTQFASLHGWEYFRRCHVGIIDYLAELKTMGWGVRISDEGEYGPRRSLTKLRRNIDEMNGVVAAAAGALKDLDEAINGTDGVQSPIFAHKDFERLEAAGEARAGAMIREARGEISGLLRTKGGKGNATG